MNKVSVAFKVKEYIREKVSNCLTRIKSFSKLSFLYFFLKYAFVYSLF